MPKKINYPSNRYTGPKPWMDKEWLYNEYVVKDRSTQQIADEYGCKQNTIQVWLLNHGIKKPILTHNIKRNDTYQNYDWLYREHITNHRSMSEIARMCNISSDTVRHHCDRMGIEVWSLLPPGDIAPHKDAIIARYLKGESLHMIGLRYGAAGATIKRMLIKNGVQPRNYSEAQHALNQKPIDPRLNDPDWLSEIRETQGMTMKDIGKLLGVDPRTVRRSMDRFGIDMDSSHVFDVSFLNTYDECLTALIKLVRRWHTNNLVAGILRRDKFVCQKCGNEFSLQVHHKVPLSTIVEDILNENPSLNIIIPKDRAIAYNLIIKDPRFLSDDNLITLCKPCHQEEHGARIQDNQQPSPTYDGEGSTTIERIS